jgi:hypothetical protein
VRRPRLVRAALTVGLACAFVVTGSSGASAAPGDPAPGTPEYLARDAQNIADAWRPVSLCRADHLSFYFCSGYDIATASGRQTDDDIAGVGCG